MSLLLRIKHVRTIRFYNVVPIPDLLSRLAAECSSGDSSGISATRSLTHKPHNALSISSIGSIAALSHELVNTK